MSSVIDGIRQAECLAVAVPAQAVRDPGAGSAAGKLMELSIGGAVNLTRDREKWRSLVATSSSADLTADKRERQEITRRNISRFRPKYKLQTT